MPDGGVETGDLGRDELLRSTYGLPSMRTQGVLPLVVRARLRYVTPGDHDGDVSRSGCLDAREMVQEDPSRQVVVLKAAEQHLDAICP